MNKRYQFFKELTVYFGFLIVLTFSLVSSADFLVPILIGILFSYLLYPIANFLETNGVPRIISNLLAILIGAALLVAGISLLSNQFMVMAENLPEIRDQAMQNIERFGKSLADSIGVSMETLTKSLEDIASGFIGGAGRVATSVFAATTNTIVRIGLMPVFIFFLLYYRNKFHDAILAMVDVKNKSNAEIILDEINSVTKNYMTGVFIVVVILSITHSVFLAIIGLNYPVLLGVTAAIFNFIPYFGTLIGAVIPLLYSFLAMDSMSYSLWVIIYFVIIQFVENNILTPNITGGKVQLNPFVTILSLILGSMLWGVAGMFLVVPFMAMIRVACEHVSFLQPIGYLMSDRGTERYSMNWDKIKGLFRKKEKDK